MKLIVREHIEFTRGENPIKTLNIGKIAVIENWFKTWASYVNYEIDDDLNIHVKGSLSFNRSKIISLPNNLHIEGYLDLEKTKIISLPDNLHIGRWLDLRDTNITSLPDDLYIEGDLYMENNNITSLPDNLHVGGNIFR